MITAEAMEVKTDTVFIPAAGKGSRLQDWRGAKALWTCGGTPNIKKIIDYYPKNWKIVVAVGYQGDTVVNAIQTFYPKDYSEGRIFPIHVRTFDDPQLGLSHTLLAAQQVLNNKSFVFHAVDTLFEEVLGGTFNYWLEEENQVVVARNLISGDYRKSTNNFEKVFCQSNETAYTGVAHIWNTNHFWKELHKLANEFPESGEVLGITENPKVHFEQKTWLDVGSDLGCEIAFSKYESNSSVVLPKKNEAIWFLEDKVVKFSTDTDFISQRYLRSRSLQPFVPACNLESNNMYSYKYIQGKTLSASLKDNHFQFSNLTEFLKMFWDTPIQPKIVIDKEDYINFYKNKTHERLNDIQKNHPELCQSVIINGIHLEELEQQLENVPWDELCEIEIGRVHGDLHPDNIIIGATGINLIDWRQNIAGRTDEYGDKYYDYAKLIHGLRVDHASIREDKYAIDVKGTNVRIELSIPPRKIELYNYFCNYLAQHQKSMSKTLTLEALIYLNIATLHSPDKYKSFLIYLGRFQLMRAFEGITDANL